MRPAPSVPSRNRLTLHALVAIRALLGVGQSADWPSSGRGNAHPAGHLERDLLGTPVECNAKLRPISVMRRIAGARRRPSQEITALFQSFRNRCTTELS